MSDHSAIEWTDATWSPTIGCLKVSDGCTNCYAIRTAYRQEHAFKRPEYAGLTRRLPNGSLNWTGRVNLLPERLSLPLTWRKPRRIFVDSQSDLFHEDVPDEFIDQVFAIMAMADWHTFQILTKRPARMLASAQRLQQRFATETPYLQAVTVPGQLKARTESWWAIGATDEYRWPLPNVWLGVSVEDQRAADERLPLLLQTPAAVRFLSCEPLLGPIDILDWIAEVRHCAHCDRPTTHRPHPSCIVRRVRVCVEHEADPDTVECLHAGWNEATRPRPRISWVIAGGESGPNYRPMDVDWARSLRDQSQAAGVAFHFKQWGGRTHAAGGRELDGRTWDEYPQTASLA